ncbi:MAG: APC family permease [Bacteroides intestinalis]|nr:APC family permease [Bacteroides intestinalis]
MGTVCFFYPLSLTFAAVTFSYAIPDLTISAHIANNKVYIIAFILLVFWLCTFIGTRGLKHIGHVSFYGVWIGIIIPVFLLIAFGIYYAFGGGGVEMNTEASALLPHFHNIDQVVMAISIMLFFSGLEVNGVHVYMMKNPATEYPKALLLTCIIIGFIYIMGTLSVATVIPSGQLSITQSVIVAFKNYFAYTGLGILLPLIAIALTFGVVANSLTWIAGPASVLKYIAEQGYLPNIVQKKNKHGAPVFILISQATVVTVLACVYALSAKVQQGYQMLLQMTNAIYLTMYAILFVAFIRLRYKDRETVRPFMAGKKLVTAWIIALVGLTAAVFSFILCFFLPHSWI